VAYLYQGQFLSKKRTAEAAAGLFGVALSDGSVANFQQMVHDKLEGFEAKAKKLALKSDVLGADETGVRVCGATAWLHVIRDEKVTVMQVHAKRGSEAMRQIGVLDKYGGILVRDALASYDAIGQREADQLCGAHLARELTAVDEFLTAHREYAEPHGWSWAEQALTALWDIKHARDQTKDGICPADVLTKNRELIVSAGLIAARGGCSPPGALGGKHRALARRITKRIDQYLLFATNPKVPFDNNGSERDLRMAKVRIKVSGCLRTMQGAEQFARMRSYLSTTAKNGIDNLDALTRAFTGNTWLPTT